MGAENLPRVTQQDLNPPCLFPGGSSPRQAWIVSAPNAFPVGCWARVTNISEMRAGPLCVRFFQYQGPSPHAAVFLSHSQRPTSVRGGGKRGANGQGQEMRPGSYLLAE